MEPPSTSPATPCAGDVAPSPLTRLTSAQYANTVRELLQIAPDVLTLRGADEKPGAFVSNSQAPLSEPTVDAYRLLAEHVAAEAVGALDRFFVCDTASSSEATCVARFISELGLRAYRRPLTPEEGSSSNRQTRQRPRAVVEVAERLVAEAHQLTEGNQ